MQVFPAGWTPKDAPCYMIIANWHYAKDPEFIKKHNIQFVVSAAGKQSNGDPAKPYEYPVNPITGKPPVVIDCPVNNLNMFASKWQEICTRCIRMWKNTGEGSQPIGVLIHCNKGINRAPAFASLIGAKLMDTCVESMAAQLWEARKISDMYKWGIQYAKAQGGQTYKNMMAVADTKPTFVPFRLEKKKNVVATCGIY